MKAPKLLGSYRNVLRHRDVRLLFGSYTVDQIGGWAATVVLIGYVYGRTGSTTDIAILTGSRLVPGLIFGSIGGVIADRFERTRVMTISALINGGLAMGFVIVVHFNSPVVALYILNAVSALAGAPYRPAAGALTPELVGEHDLAATNSLYSTLQSGVVVLGPVVGAALYKVGGATTGVLADGVTFWMAAAIVSRLTIRSRGAAEPGGNPIGQWVDGIKALLSARTAFVLVLFAGLDSAVYGAATDIYAPLSVRLGTGINGYGYLLAGIALGGVIGAGVANRLSASPRLAPVLIGSIALQAIPFLATEPVHAPIIGFLLQVASGVGMIIVDVLAMTALQRDVSGAVLSRVLGAFDVVILGSIAAAGFISAAIFSANGLNAVLVSIGIGFPIAALLGLPVLLTADRAAAAKVASVAPRIAVLSALDLFAGARHSALEQLAAAAVQEELPARSIVIKEGDDADALWILLSGSLTVRARGDGSQAKQLPTVEAPGYVGELGLIHSIPRTATVRTRENSVLLRISKADFFTALDGAAVSSSLSSLAGRRMARTPRSRATDRGSQSRT